MQRRTYRDHAGVTAFFAGLELVEPGIVGVPAVAARERRRRGDAHDGLVRSGQEASRRLRPPAPGQNLMKIMPCGCTAGPVSGTGVSAPVARLSVAR